MLSASPSRSGKRRHPEKERALTIAAGFVCSNGLVLATDTLYTGITRRFGKKLWWFSAGETVVAIAGAGTSMHLRHVKEQIRKRLKPDMSVDQIVQAADDIVYALCCKHATAEPHEDWELDLLIGIRATSGLFLYENQGSYTFEPVEDEKKCRCIGCGNRIGVYLTEWLFDPSLTTQGATTIAAHTLTQAIAGDPLCGGETHILVIPSALDQEPSYLDQPTISVLAGQLSKIERAVRDVLVYAPGPNLNEETIELRFKALEDAARAARNVIIRLTGVAAITMTGRVAVLGSAETSDDGKD